MAEFYRFPHGILTMLVMAVALCIVLQALNISYSIRRLRAGWARIAENGMECAVLPSGGRSSGQTKRGEQGSPRFFTVSSILSKSRF